MSALPPKADIGTGPRITFDGQQLWQLRDIRRDPPRFARNAALRYVQEGVMEFATMYSNLLRDDN